MSHQVFRQLRLLSTCTALLCFAFPAVESFAVSLSFDASKDNTLYEDNDGTLSNGAGFFLFAGQAGGTAGNANRRAVVAFDISMIPAGAIVDSVEVSFTTGTRVNAANDFSLYKLTQDWGEGTSDAGGQEGGGAPSTPGDATWIHSSFDSTFWSASGGDFAGSPSATTTFGGNTDTTEVFGSTPDLVSDVQDWLDNGGNYGWVLIGNEVSSNTAYQFHSRTSSLGAGPVLEVTYTVIPEPATVGLLALALASSTALGRRQSYSKNQSR